MHDYYQYIALSEGEFQDMFLAAGIVRPCLRYGEVQLLHTYLDKRIRLQAQFDERKRRGESHQVHWMEQWYGWAYFGRPCMRFGLVGLARSYVTDVLRLERWADVKQFALDVWPVIDGIFGRERVGTREQNLDCFFLEMYLIGHTDAPAGEISHLVSHDPERMIARDRECFLGRAWTFYSLAEVAALVCEQLGLDVLAERYAKYVLGEYHHVGIRVSVLGVLARLERKRGGGSAAIQQFERAAAEAMGSEQPFLALRIGRECGGQEGQRMVEKAAADMGRPAKQLLDDYEGACTLSTPRSTSIARVNSGRLQSGRL